MIIFMVEKAHISPICTEGLKFQRSIEFSCNLSVVLWVVILSYSQGRSYLWVMLYSQEDFCFWTFRWAFLWLGANWVSTLWLLYSCRLSTLPPYTISLPNPSGLWKILFAWKQFSSIWLKINFGIWNSHGCEPSSCCYFNWAKAKGVYEILSFILWSS